MEDGFLLAEDAFFWNPKKEPLRPPRLQIESDGICLMGAIFSAYDERVPIADGSYVLHLDDNRAPWGRPQILVPGYSGHDEFDDIRFGVEGRKSWSDLDYNHVVWAPSPTHFEFALFDIGRPQHIAFDHDLGKPKNGFDCAKMLTEETFPESYSAHSGSSKNAKEILSYLESFEQMVVEGA